MASLQDFQSLSEVGVALAALIDKVSGIIRDLQWQTEGVEFEIKAETSLSTPKMVRPSI